MHFSLVNESKDPAITAAVLHQIAAACERQLYEHYAPFWESAGAPVQVSESLKAAPTDGCIVAILDSSDQAGALGYHDVTPDGRPYARIFWEPIRDSGGTLITGANSLSVTISHEVLETIGDPYASFWAADYSTATATVKQYALELADAVESDAYDIDGVSVSNFVGPRFFRQGNGPYDWMLLVTRPFETRPGGYQIVMDGSGVDQEFGAGYPEWKKPGKAFAAARTMKRKAA